MQVSIKMFMCMCTCDEKHITNQDETGEMKIYRIQVVEFQDCIAIWNARKYRRVTGRWATCNENSTMLQILPCFSMSSE